MSDMKKGIFEEQSYGKAALPKIGPVHENFRLYLAGWAGDFDTSDTMEIKGCVFREAKSGKHKGKLCIPVIGTEKHVFVTISEMKEF